MIEERGAFVKWGGEECPSLGHLAGYGREREREIFLVEVGGIVWSRIFRKDGILENGKGYGLWRKERNKGKGKMEKKL